MLSIMAAISNRRSTRVPCCGILLVSIILRAFLRPQHCFYSFPWKHCLLHCLLQQRPLRDGRLSERLTRALLALHSQHVLPARADTSSHSRKLCLEHVSIPDSSNDLELLRPLRKTCLQKL